VIPAKVIHALPYVGAIGIGLGIAGARSLILNPDFVLVRWYRAYTSLLGGYLRDLWLEVSPTAIVVGQAVAIAVIVGLGVHGDLPYWWAALLLAASGPALQLHLKAKKRIEALELQIDGFLLAYANTMKTVANPSTALFGVLDVLQNPIRQEIDRALREMRVGKSLEEALRNMSARVRNRTLDASLCAVLIGIQVGGDLPEVLTTTAGVIREMQRLEGVIRTKTADGRSQLWVLGAFPAVLYLAMSWMSPGFYDQMSTTVPGYALSAIAITVWISAIAMARKIVAVDI
jgi:tight adherence protein B